MWIYGPLTDVDAALIATLPEIGMMEAVVEPAPEPDPAPTPEPVATSQPTPEPVPAQPPAAPIPVADCQQLHTVNANETRLQQITDWYGLDLNTVAALNGIDANAPLTTGSLLCLSGTDTVTAVEPTPEPTEETAPPSSLAFPTIRCQWMSEDWGPA